MLYWLFIFKMYRLKHLKKIFILFFLKKNGQFVMGCALVVYKLLRPKTLFRILDKDNKRGGGEDDMKSRD